MKLILSFVVLFFVFSCEPRIKIDNFKIIDFDSAKAQVNFDNLGYAHYKHNSRTSLNEEEFSVLFQILEEGVNRFNVKNKNRQININDYRFFIIPTLFENNEEILLIYSYRFHPHNEWINLSDWFMVFDGGHNYFRTKVNLTQKKLEK